MKPDEESLVNARLWLAFALMLFVSGFSNTFPVFFPPLLEEFGGSRAATAATVSLLWTGGALVGALAGYLVVRYNPRWVVIAGIFAMALGLALGTLAPTLPWFVAVVGGLGGIGVGLTGMVTQAALLADTYVRRRGLANGIAFSGSMAGFLAALPAQMLITHAGWRGAFVGYVVVLLLLVPAVWRILPVRLVSAAAASGGEHAQVTVRGIVVTPAFWVLTDAVHHATAGRQPHHDAARAVLPRPRLLGRRGLGDADGRRCPLDLRPHPRRRRGRPLRRGRGRHPLLRALDHRARLPAGHGGLAVAASRLCLHLLRLPAHSARAPPSCRCW